MHYFIGMDVGGTKTEVCLLSLSDLNKFERFQVLARERIPTEKQSTFEVFLREMGALVQKILRDTQINIDQIQGIGVGLPGSIDPVTQVMAQGNVAFFKGQDLKTAYENTLQYKGPIIFDNDANCFALAEAYLGAGKQWANSNGVPLQQLCMVGVTLGTGLGGGLIVNGQLIRGRRGGAGEIGHITLVENGRPCYCGKRGCAEQYLSGTGFEYSYSSKASLIEKKKGSEIFALADQGDALSLSTIEHYRDDLVKFLSNVSNFLDPHVIVLGGGMSTQPRIYPGIADRLSKECFLTENPPGVVPNECGDSAGVLGAALLSIWSKK